MAGRNSTSANASCACLHAAATVASTDVRPRISSCCLAASPFFAACKRSRDTAGAGATAAVEMDYLPAPDHRFECFVLSCRPGDIVFRAVFKMRVAHRFLALAAEEQSIQVAD